MALTEVAKRIRWQMEGSRICERLTIYSSRHLQVVPRMGLSVSGLEFDGHFCSPITLMSDEIIIATIST